MPDPRRSMVLKKAVILESGNLSLVGASLSQAYVLGGHLDQDPLNTSFSPVSEHPELDISQAKIDQTLFIGHFPGLKAKWLDDAAVSTQFAVKSKFVLRLEGSGFTGSRACTSIAADPDDLYAPDASGQKWSPICRGLICRMQTWARYRTSPAEPWRGPTLPGPICRACNLYLRRT